MNTPLVSIITICFNAESLIERTILSVGRLDYPNVEYLIVDGKSKDGTMDIVRKHADVVTRYVSEPDKGIYDAMNKGLSMAQGDYVWFVNAGDEVASADVLKNAMLMMPNADVYYGDTEITDMEQRVKGLRRLRPPKRLTWKSFDMGMLVCHQSFVARRALSTPYDTQYHFSADFDWCINVLRRSRMVCNTGQVMSRFLEGGTTKQNEMAGLRERFRIMRKHYGLMRTLFCHALIVVRRIVSLCL